MCSNNSISDYLSAISFRTVDGWFTPCRCHFAYWFNSSQTRCTAYAFNLLCTSAVHQVVHLWVKYACECALSCVPCFFGRISLLSTSSYPTHHWDIQPTKLRRLLSWLRSRFTLKRLWSWLVVFHKSEFLHYFFYVLCGLWLAIHFSWISGKSLWLSRSEVRNHLPRCVFRFVQHCCSCLPSSLICLHRLWILSCVDV